MLVCKKQQAYFGMHFLLATEGKTFERSLAAFRATSAGWDLLQRRPKSWDYLSNRSMLQACPPGSLGSLYAAFMTTHGLDEKYYLGTVIENAARLSDDAECVWFRTRVEASHDMRHFLAGYGPDVLGEVCLLSFRFAQTRHAGTLALTLLGLLNLALTSRGPFLGAILEAYRRGRSGTIIRFIAMGGSICRAALGSSRGARAKPSPMLSRFGRTRSLWGFASGSAGRRDDPRAKRLIRLVDPKMGWPAYSLVDLIETFGPMSGMHAAMDRQGAGTPCGLIVRFQDRTAAEVAAAVETARGQFPVLERRIAWHDSAPCLLRLRRLQPWPSHRKFHFPSNRSWTGPFGATGWLKTARTLGSPQFGPTLQPMAIPCFGF